MSLTQYNVPTDKAYLRQLLQKAEEYVSCSYLTIAEFDEVTFFYRNKPEEYFREVKRNNNILKKIRKDFNGDPRSPINDRLDGVFLGVSLFRGNLPTRSPFGNTRVHIPIEAVFRESTNLYFTDFYCSTSSSHYVTLVLTRQSTPEDVFCQRSLLKLNPMDNSFLRMRCSSFSAPTFTTARRAYLYVEVFYTENIDLNILLLKYGPEKVFFKKTEIVGRGHSTRGGLRKNSFCSLCNPALPDQIQMGTLRNPFTGGINYTPEPKVKSWGESALPNQNQMGTLRNPFTGGINYTPEPEVESWGEWLSNKCTIM